MVSPCVRAWGAPPSTGTRHRCRRSISFWFEEYKTLRPSELSVTSSTSNRPGVSKVGAPPALLIEYRWFQPSCSEANTIRLPAANLKDVSSVSSGSESFSAEPLCQISCPAPVEGSATQIAQGCEIGRAHV